MGEQETGRALTAQAIGEHLSGDLAKRAITEQVLSALCKLTRLAEPGEPLY